MICESDRVQLEWVIGQGGQRGQRREEEEEGATAVPAQYSASQTVLTTLIRFVPYGLTLPLDLALAEFHRRRVSPKYSIHAGLIAHVPLPP